MKRIISKYPPPLAKLATLTTALIALLMTGQVWAQNCQTFYNPELPITGITGNDRHYKCYQRFVWFNQGKGSWCARDWYRSCMHSGWHDVQVRNMNGIWVKDPSQDAGLDGGANRIEVGQNGWVTGYAPHDTGRVAPREIYVSGGQIIVYPYVCRGSLKTTPEDPGQRIQSNDGRAKMFFPNPTLSEIRTYKTSGSCGGCPAGGNLTGTGCN